MMVQLEQPFVWPEEPAEEDLKRDFDQERYSKLAGDRERQMKGVNNEERRMKERLSVAEQAQRLLEGKDRWKDLDVSAAQTPSTGRFNLPIR